MRRGRGIRGLRSGGLARGSYKDFFQETQELAHLHASDEKRRQKTQRGIVRAVDQQTAAHGFRNIGSTLDGELDANHEAFPANFADEGEFGGQCGKALAQFRAACADIFEEIFVLNDVEKLERGGAGERAAAKGSAVQTGRNTLGNGFCGEDGPKREARCKRFGNQNDIGHGRKLLVREIAAAAAQAALNFIGDEKRAVPGSQGSGTLPELFADRKDAAFALNGFEKNGADGAVKFRFKISQVVEADKFDAGNERSKGEPVFFRGSDADGAERAAVERILKGQNAVLGRRSAGSVSRSAPVKPG